MEQKFKVIYLGRLAEGVDESQVTPRFAEKFKMPEAKASKILTAGKEVVLHPGAEHVKAYKLKAALEALGLQMRLERSQTESQSEQPESAPKDNTEQENTAVLETQNTPEPQETKRTQEPEPTAQVHRTFDTSAMSLEPMAEETEEEEEEKETTAENQEQPVEEKETAEAKETETEEEIDSPSWDLEPMKEESEESEEGDESDDPEGENKKVIEKQDYVDLSKPAMVYEKKKPAEESDDASAEENKEVSTEEDSSDKEEKEEPSKIIGLIKQFGGVAVAGLAGILFLMKKFGLFKILKIGGVMAVAAYAGYNPEEACMGNGACEDAVSDQIDACWSYSELDQHDWDNISDDQYFELKPQIEEKFIGCFRYEETGAQVFESPIELRFELLAMCDELSTPVSDCDEIAEPQIKTCYDRAEIFEPIKASGYDYYGTMLTNMEQFTHFYSCFEDNSGNRLFGELVDQMGQVDQEAINAALEELQQEMDNQ